VDITIYKVEKRQIIMNEEIDLLKLISVLIPKIELLTIKLDTLEDKLDETCERLEALPCQEHPEVKRICVHKQGVK
jgi:hypothetical protein